MALINCPECGKEISSKTQACVYCGYPLTENSNMISCQSCGALNPASNDYCDECSMRITPYINHRIVPKSTTVDTKKTTISKLFPIITSVLCVILLIYLIKPHPNKSEYKTTLVWASQENYLMAIEYSNFDGDVFESGIYQFTISNNTLGHAPMYDIYISDHLYDSVLDLQISMDPTLTVGGVGYTSDNVTLSKGDYVYIIPCDLIYSPSGHLKMSLTK